MTPLQRAALTRRYRAAANLELTRQQVRELACYGRATERDRDSVHRADVAYNEATRAVSAA
jgi:hypothetical protein